MTTVVCFRLVSGVEKGDHMALLAHGLEPGPSGTLQGKLKLRLPFLGSRGTFSTTVEVDGQAVFGGGSDGGFGHVDGTLMFRNPVELRLEAPEGRGGIAGDLSTKGQARLDLSLPAGVERIDGEVAFNGPLELTGLLPGSGVTLKLPATIDGVTSIRTTAPACFCLDAQAVIAAPLGLRLPLAGASDAIDLNVTIKGDAALRMAFPGRQGQLQARAIAAGAIALLLALPGGHGQLSARGSVNTAATLSMVMPEGRAKLNVDDTITSEVELRVTLPRGGQVESRAPIHARLHGVLFLPSSGGELQIAAPIHTTVHIKGASIPGSGDLLSADIGVDALAEMTLVMPARDALLRLRFDAAIPLAPLVHLVHSQVARQVRVEYMELGPPQLMSAHDLALPLYVEARKGLLAKVEVTAHLHIDPSSRRLELHSIHAHGLNAAGRAASSFYLNHKLFRPMRHTLLFDPSTVLPPTAHVESLSFKSVSRETLVIAGAMTLSVGPSSS